MSNGASRSVAPAYQLYPYQRQVLVDILHSLSMPERRVVAHLPTGAGKTRIASHAACRLLNRSDDPKSLLVWLASSEELCEQAADELGRAWRHLGLRAAMVHRLWGKHSPDLRTLESGFLVAGLAKIRAVAFSDHTVLAHLSQVTAGVVFDEAHQAIAATYSFITEQVCTSRPPLLGLTATPGRTADVTDDDHRLAQMFCRRKVSIDPQGHDSPVTFLIANRYLAKARFVPIRFRCQDQVPDPSPGVDYASRHLTRIGQNDARTRTIVELAFEAASRHPRTIVFCPSVESAANCRALLHALGVSTDVVTAATSRDERRDAISAFKSDDPEPMVLFNYGVLTTGFDAPRTRCAIIARPTTSLVLYSQMAGRAMRGPRAGGNPMAEILTVADTNLPGFGSVTEAFRNWESLWKTN